MRLARFRDPKIIQQACFVLKMLTSYDQEDPVQVKTLYEMSELLATLTYFNIDRPDFMTSIVKQTLKLFKSNDPLAT
jgi:hypothetical protein